MKALIDALEIALKGTTATGRAKVEAFGPTGVIPERMPYINILPRAKERTRQFFIGAEIKQYDVEPEIEIHVWGMSMKSLRAAFEEAEALAEDVLNFLADVTPATLGVDWHESQIEEYNDDSWEGYNYYEVIIVLSAKKQESH